jgi:hypothetical protein
MTHEEEKQAVILHVKEVITNSHATPDEIIALMEVDLEDFLSRFEDKLYEKRMIFLDTEITTEYDDDSEVEEDEFSEEEDSDS